MLPFPISPSETSLCVSENVGKAKLEILIFMIDLWLSEYEADGKKIE